MAEEEQKMYELIVSKEEEIEGLKEQLDSMKSDMDSQKKDLDKSDKYAKLLGDLFEKGVIDEEGNMLDDFAS